MLSNVRSLSLAAVTLLSCARAESTPVSRSIDEPPEKTVEHLATAAHGIANLSEDFRVRIAMIKRDPGPYLRVIRDKYPAGTIASLALRPPSEMPVAPTAAGDFITTAGVLGQIDDPRASELVEAWWVEVDAALSAGAPSSAAPLLEDMFAALLSALGDRPRDRVTSRILGGLERMEGGKRVAAVQYLVRSNQGNAEVLRRLRALYEGPASRLHGDQYVEKAIRALSEQRRAPTVDPERR